MNLGRLVDISNVVMCREDEEYLRDGELIKTTGRYAGIEGAIDFNVLTYFKLRLPERRWTTTRESMMFGRLTCAANHVCPIAKYARRAPYLHALLHLRICEVVGDSSG